MNVNYKQYSIVIMPSEVIEIGMSKFSLLFIILSHFPTIGKKLLAATMFILTSSIFNFFSVDLEASQ